MLHRIIAPIGCGKQQRILEEAKKALEQNKRVFLIVPEQATAQYEYALISLCGNRLAAAAEVTNFSRLPDTVLRACGSITKRSLSEMEKKILLAETVLENRDTLSAILSRTDADAIERLYRDLEELRLVGLDGKALSEISRKTDDRPALSEKLAQSAMLVTAWRDSLSRRYPDCADAAEQLCEVLDRERFFAGSVVLLDGFWDLTAPQSLVLRRILSQADEIWMSFVCRKRRESLFEKGYACAVSVLRMAREIGIRVEDESLDEPIRQGDLAFLRENCARAVRPKSEAPEGIEILSAACASQEALAVAHEIRRLAKEGVRWGEICILSRSGEWDELLSLTLEAAGIPSYCESRLDLKQNSFAQTVLLSAAIALGEGDESDLRQYLSVGEFTCDPTERYLLEKYVATWGITPRAIRSDRPFTMNPDGYDSFCDDSRAELAQINLARKTVLSPLVRLSMGLSVGTVQEKVTAIVAHLNAIGTQREMTKACQADRAAARFDRAAARVRAWNCVLERLSALVRAVGERECDASHFLSLLSLSLSGPLPGQVPPAQDRVQIGTAAFSRPKGARAVFLFGMNAGVFPAAEAKSGLLSPSERSLLSESYGYALSCGDRAQNEEFFYFYHAVCAAEEKLFLSYQEGEDRAPSLFVKRTLALFSDWKPKAFVPEKAIPSDENALFSYWMRHLNRAEELPKIREWIEEDAGRAARSMNGAEGLIFASAPHRIPSGVLCSQKEVNMTYSRLEQYAKCPYSYFANYHLKAKRSARAQLGANIVGNFVHAVLEKVLIGLQRDGEALSAQSDDALSARNRLACREFLKGEISAEDDARSRALYRRIESSTLLILKNLREEFSVSGFAPIFFEKELSELDGKGYRIPLPSGGEIVLQGKIDRVDLYQNKKGESYVRVVDYKTGSKDFSLDDVANGLELQMILYLFALWENGFTYENEHIAPLPAGVIYLTGMEESRSVDSPASLSEAKKAPFESLGRQGLALNDEALLSVQDAEGKGAYLPVKWKSGRAKKDHLVTLAEMGRLKKRVEKLVSDRVEAIRGGEIEAMPLYEKEEHSPCVYCDYKAICKRPAGACRPYRTHVERDEVFGKEDTNE